MNLRVITTGGTIGGLDYQRKENEPTNVDISIKAFFNAANVTFQYNIDSAFKKDSRFMTARDRKIIAKKIMSSEENKILVTHGTYTMTETANYLSNLNLNKTIVLVGAFILGTEKNTDAPFNLGYAIAALQFLDHGVYIAMNGEIFNQKNVQKNLKENRFEPLSD